MRVEHNGKFYKITESNFREKDSLDKLEVVMDIIDGEFIDGVIQYNYDFNETIYSQTELSLPNDYEQFIDELKNEAIDRCFDERVAFEILVGGCK